MVDKQVSIYLSTTSMLTCLGNQEQTINALQQNRTGLQFVDRYGMHAGLLEMVRIEGFSRFESVVIKEIEKVLKEGGFTLSDSSTILILATTKGNVEALEKHGRDAINQASIAETAMRIGRYFNCKNSPVVISNACISGVSAFIVAQKYLSLGLYETAVIVGCDLLSDFITQGFVSFKSISTGPCRPYDKDRDGLTLGEACGVAVLTVNEERAVKPVVRICGGAITNDANHISGPSRTGDALAEAMMNAMRQANVSPLDIGFINMHGTATLYNDEMESKAVKLSGLDKMPINGMKGYFGHTLGASGVIETIVSAVQLRKNMIYATKGFSQKDNSSHLKITSDNQPLTQDTCIKTASGFGGCNAAIVLKTSSFESNAERLKWKDSVSIGHYRLKNTDTPFSEYIRNEFKTLGFKDMKFYKMSDLSKALYISVSKLLSLYDISDVIPSRRAIVMANKSSSLDSDILHQDILDKHLPEGASPAVFVYTLPNVAVGEVCIKYHIKGENTFFIESEESGLSEKYAQMIIGLGQADAVICGWCEYLCGKWDVNIKLLKVQ